MQRRGAGRILPAAFAVLGVGQGCSYDWVHPPDGGAPHDASRDAPHDAPNDAPRGEAGAPCSPQAACPAGQLCVYPDFECGQGNAGACVPFDPADCQDNASHTYCFCGGQAAAGFCAQQGQGIDFAICPPPPPAGTFRCGYVYCGVTEYCVETTMNGGRASYRCVPPPNGCLPADCSCNSVGNQCTCSSIDFVATYVCTP